MIRRSIAALMLASALTQLACDPAHSSAVDAVGPDPSGERNGPTHRAGQPCLLCHDGTFGNPRKFNVAGTVYMSSVSSLPAIGVTVNLTGADGATYAAQTNRVGNFYLEEGRFTPVYPMRVSITSGSVKSEMKSHVGRDGSCAGCHVDPAGAASPGHVYVEEADGGGD